MTTNVPSIYFSTVAYKNKWEIDIIRDLRPAHILVSFFYLRKYPLDGLVRDLGYRPVIMLDSGAYSAWSLGKNISLVDYLAYLIQNKDHIDHYLSLDVIPDGSGVDSEAVGYGYYSIMRDLGLHPIPCYHYGSPPSELQRYVDDGNAYIALGNTVPVRNKALVADWVRSLIKQYPSTQFHLLGSSSKKVLEVDGLTSCDASTWITGALMGIPAHIPGKSKDNKIARATFNMRELMLLSHRKDIDDEQVSPSGVQWGSGQYNLPLLGTSPLSESGDANL